MKFYRLDAHKQVTLYPIVCMHLGAPQADIAFIKEHVARIAADPTGRWISMGDSGECVTRASKGEIYDQTMSPDAQIDAVVNLLEPIRGKGLFGISGNHDRRISKLSGVDWTNALCARLGIPYLGLSAFMRVVLTRKQERSNSAQAVDCFFHHGTDSSSNIGGKVNKARALGELVEADAVFSAHSHICGEVPSTYRTCIVKDGLQTRETRNYICGCAYDSRVPGYAEEKGYSPILPAWLSVTLRYCQQSHRNPARTGPAEFVSQTCQIWRATL